MSDTRIQLCETKHTASMQLSNTRVSHQEAGCGKKYSFTEVLYLKLNPLAVYNKRLPGTILSMMSRGGDWPVRLDVCTFNIFLLYYVTYLTPPSSLCSVTPQRTQVT